MKTTMAASLVIASATIATTLPKPAAAAWVDYKHWSYNCMKDHTDAYGDVLNPRNCWASADSGSGLVSVFSFTAKRRGLSLVEPREACEYAPRKIAVDGKRIDMLDDAEQIAAVLKGKQLTRQVWERGWPYCTFRDVSVSLDGAGEVYKRLVKMAPKFLSGN